MGIETGFGADAFDGLVPHTMADVEELNKALSATYGYEGAPTSLTGGGVLQVESLDNTMKVVTFEEQHLKLWQMIPKSRASNTVEELNRMQSWGAMPEGMGFFDAEAQVLPTESDPAFTREILKIRYIGDTRIVTHPASLVRTSGESMMAIQARAGVVNVLGMMERALFRASSFFLSPTTGVQSGDVANLPTNNLQFLGIEEQIRYGDSAASAQYVGWDGYGGNISNVVDKAGSDASPDDLEEIGRVSIENWGMPTHLMIPPQVLSKVSRQYMDKERINSLGNVNGSAGYVLTSFCSSGGIYQLVPSNFLRQKTSVKVAADASAPATPAVGGTGTEADTTASLLTATYSFRVSALNKSGESLACAHFEQAVVAGNRVTITISAGTTGATHYAIYQAAPGATTGHAFVGFVKDSLAAGGGGVTARVRGDRAPGASTAFLLSISERMMSVRQLCPIMKMDLAILTPAFRFMVLLYAAPWVMAPKQAGVLLDNVGGATN